LNVITCFGDMLVSDNAMCQTPNIPSIRSFGATASDLAYINKHIFEDVYTLCLCISKI